MSTQLSVIRAMQLDPSATMGVDLLSTGTDRGRRHHGCALSATVAKTLVQGKAPTAPWEAKSNALAASADKTNAMGSEDQRLVCISRSDQGKNAGSYRPRMER